MSENRELDNAIKQYKQMGFDTQDIIMAFLGTSRKCLLLDNLISLNSAKISPEPLKKGNSKAAYQNALTQSQQVFETEVEKAIKLSLVENENQKIVPPNEVKRVGMTPVGLKNIGNTCYFNSLLQTLFQIKEFVIQIFSFKEPSDINELLSKLEISDEMKERKKKSVELVKALRKLFGLMINGNRKYLDPTEVFANISDSQGKIVTKGEQLDFSEFCINFMERVEEGLSLQDSNVSKLVGSNHLDNLCGSVILNGNEKIKNYVEDKDKDSDNEGGATAQNLFSNLFFGLSKDYITFEWSDYKTKKNQDAVFGPLNIDLGPKNLADSLETFYNFSIDDYKCPDGEVTTARKKCWIAKPPKILSLILRRVEFDLEAGKLKKTHGEFTFPKEINLDKYLLENKKKLRETAKIDDIRSLKQREKSTETELTSLHNADSRGNSAEYLLRQANQFIKSQLQDLEVNDFVDIDTSGEADEKLTSIGNKKELEAASATLAKLQQKVHKRVNELEDRKAKIKRKMDSANCELTHLKYRLYSVIVHMGSRATSGHYFTYIYNFKSKKWNRISDEQVSEVTEDEVLKISKGGYNDCCAYSLFYMQDGMEPHGHSEEDLKELARSMDKNLEETIKKENQKFDIEHNQYNSNFIQTVYDEYLMRMNRFSFEASTFIADSKKKAFPSLPILPNFSTFMMLDPKLNKEMARWSALNDILTTSNVPYQVLQGDKNNFYYKELEQILVNKTCIYNLTSLELDFSKQSVYNAKRKEFLNYYKIVVIIKKIFNLILNRKWKESIIGISLINDLLSNYQIQEYNKWFYSFSSYILVLLAMKVCSLIDMTYLRGDMQELLQLQKVLIYSITNKRAIKPPQIFFNQILANLNYVVSISEGKKPEIPEMFIFKHLISKLKEDSEFMPLGEVSSPIIKDMLKELDALEKNPELVLCSTFTMDSSLKDLYKRVLNERLSLWVQFEEQIRTKDRLIPQEERVDKESLTFPNEL